MSRSPSTSSLPPVPIAILSPPTGSVATDEYGLYPRAVARLIVNYTRPGDVVVDLDGATVVDDAARWLERHVAHGGQLANLVIVRLPAMSDLPDDDRGWVRRWRARLASGGYLVVAMTTTGARDRATSVIAAARTEGLRYQQHLVAVIRALPEGEPRAEEATAAGTRSSLIDGLHRSDHASLFVFAGDGDGHG